MILQHPSTVEFDPSKKQHREAVMKFMVRNAWVDSPIRFTYDPAFGSIADQVKSKLLQWYMSKDIAKPKKVEGTGVTLVSVASFMKGRK